MDVAELYMSMVRPTGVPVVGECMADGYIGQIQVEKWTWSLVNDDEEEKAEKAAEKYSRHTEFLEHQKTKDLDKRILDLQFQEDSEKAEKDQRKKILALSADMSTAGLAGDKAKVAELKKQIESASSDFADEMKDLRRSHQVDVDKLTKEWVTDDDKLNDRQREAKKLEADKKKLERKNRSYEFSFSKRVDFSTTQLLNSMKAGDVFPLATLTINQRSSNSGLFIEFTVTNLRLIDYNVRADVGETMTDMKEQWKATFRSLAYVYKNRKTIDSTGSGREAVTKVMTQGTVRTFAMKKDLPF